MCITSRGTRIGLYCDGASACYEAGVGLVCFRLLTSSQIDRLPAIGGRTFKWNSACSCRNGLVHLAVGAI